MGVVIFDYDGPLAASFDMQYRWYEKACKIGRDNGLNTHLPCSSVEEFRNYYDLGDYIAMYEKVGFNWSEHRDLIWKHFLEFQKENEAPIVEGVASQLEKLANRGHTLAIASNNNPKVIRNTLKREGLLRYFSTVVGHTKEDGDDKLKPNPYVIVEAMRRVMALPDNTIYVGDTCVDHEAAQRVAEVYAQPVKTLGVTWGWTGRDALVPVYGTRLVHDVANLADEIDDLLFEKRK